MVFLYYWLSIFFSRYRCIISITFWSLLITFTLKFLKQCFYCLCVVCYILNFNTKLVFYGYYSLVHLFKFFCFCAFLLPFIVCFIGHYTGLPIITIFFLLEFCSFIYYFYNILFLACIFCFFFTFCNRFCIFFL